MKPQSDRWTARAALLLATVLAVIGCVGCSASSDAGPATVGSTTADAAGARPVTTEESQLLAVVRFNNFDAGSRAFTTGITEKGSALRLRGWIDYASHLGYAAVTDANGTDAFQPQALLWNGKTVGVHDAAPDADGNPPLPILNPADQAWLSHPLDASTSRLDALLISLGGLANDRPDNPVLIQQAGALWLRTDTIDGTPVTVFAAPPSDQPAGPSSAPITAETSPLRLWVDAAGLLRRAEMKIGGDWTTADFPAVPGATAPVLTLPTATS